MISLAPLLFRRPRKSRRFKPPYLPQMDIIRLGDSRVVVGVSLRSDLLASDLRGLQRLRYLRYTADGCNSSTNQTIAHGLTHFFLELDHSSHRQIAINRVHLPVSSVLVSGADLPSLPWLASYLPNL